MKHAVLVIPTEFNAVTSEKIDRRRDKEYARRVVFAAQIFIKNDAYSDPTPWPKEHLQLLLKDAYPEVRWLTDCHYSSKDSFAEAHLWLHATATFWAEKPSQTLSAEECTAELGGEAAVLEMFQQACAKAQEIYDNKRARQQIAQEAEALSRYLAEHITEQADLNIRYEQCLAALRAERKAEMEVLAKTTIDDRINKVRSQWDKDEEWFQLVASYAKGALDEHLKERREPSMFRGVKKHITEDTVELPEGFLPREGWPDEDEELQEATESG